MPVPSTSVLDDFTRSDAADLGASYGTNIESGYASCQVVSNTARPVSAFKSNYWNSSFSADQEAYATVTTMPGASFRLWARISNPGGASLSGYYIVVFASGDFYLERIVSGAAATIATLGGVGSFTSGSKLALQCVGSTIRGYIDTGSGWVQAGTDQTDSNVTGAGYVGFQWGNSATGTLDNLGGGSLASAVYSHPFVNQRRSRRNTLVRM